MCGPSAGFGAPGASGEPGIMGRPPLDVKMIQAGGKADRDPLVDVLVDRDSLLDAIARVLNHLLRGSLRNARETAAQERVPSCLKQHVLHFGARRGLDSRIGRRARNISA